MSITTMIVAIVAIVAGLIYSGIKANLKSKNERTNQDDFDLLQQEMAQMKERLETLEKIVTDEKYDLKKEINSL